MLGNFIANAIAGELQARRMNMLPRRMRAEGMDEWKMEQESDEDIARELERYTTEWEME